LSNRPDVCDARCFDAGCMTQHVHNEPLAGLEFQFTSGDLIAIWTLIALATVVAVAYAACFIGALVSSTQYLHRSGRVNHAWLLPLPSIAAVLYPYVSHDWLHGWWSIEAGLAWGYAVMFWAGRGWIRWTAVPVLVPAVLIGVGVR
jgi:hypothetical protein